MSSSKKALDNLSYKIIGAAIEVRKHLGPGLLESVYQKCLALEFANQEIILRQELKVHLEYKGKRIDTEFRCDFLV